MPRHFKWLLKMLVLGGTKGHCALWKRPSENPSLVPSHSPPRQYLVVWFEQSMFGKCVIVVPRMQLSDRFFACCLICCVALQLAKLPNHQSIKTASNILPSHKLTNSLTFFFCWAQSLKERSADVYSFRFCTKIANFGIKSRWPFCFWWRSNF